jgi:hypothetical protein
MSALGALLAGSGGIALLMSLWLDWFHVAIDTTLFNVSGGVDAWQAFERIDVLLAVIGIVALCAAVATWSGSGELIPRPTVGAAGIVALAAIGYALSARPPGSASLPGFVDSASLQHSGGFWIAAAGAVAILASSFFAGAQRAPRKQPESYLLEPLVWNDSLPGPYSDS